MGIGGPRASYRCKCKTANYRDLSKWGLRKHQQTDQQTYPETNKQNTYNEQQQKTKKLGSLLFKIFIHARFERPSLLASHDNLHLLKPREKLF